MSVTECSIRAAANPPAAKIVAAPTGCSIQARGEAGDEGVIRAVEVTIQSAA